MSPKSQKIKQVRANYILIDIGNRMQVLTQYVIFNDDRS